MPHKINILASLLMAATLCACEKDNYKAPDASISGNIVDAAGKNVPLQTLNGSLLQLYQTTYAKPEPINAAIHSDGTYANSFIFSGNYKIVVTGPFVYRDTLNVNINGNLRQDIKVQPYLAVTCEVVGKTATEISVKVKIKRDAQNGQKIARVAVVAGLSNSTDINVYYNVDNAGNGRVLENTEGLADDAAEAKEYLFKLTKLNPKTKYYVRGCARTINPGSFYNYATMLEVTTD